jgi:hypothetical protein
MFLLFNFKILLVWCHLRKRYWEFSGLAFKGKETLDDSLTPLRRCFGSEMLAAPFFF